MATRTMSALPPLSRALLFDPDIVGRHGVSLPPAGALDLPERVIQFGTGAFLRGFVGSFIDDANRRGTLNGRIVAVSSTGSGRDAAINRQNGLYTLVVQGRDGARTRQDVRIVAATSRALSAQDEWPAVLQCARDPRIRLVFSNTTEVGIALDEPDAQPPGPPRSFPGKMTVFLLERASALDFDPAHAPVVIPCELIEGNGDRLRDIVTVLASRWRLDHRFAQWLESVPFCNTLVDRIVTSAAMTRPADDARPDYASGYHDELLTFTERYRLFAIEGGAELRSRLQFGDEEGVLVATDITPYRVRKVRILNGAHTIVAPVALLSQRETVADTTGDPLLGAFQRRVMFDEIVPSLNVPGAAEFAHEVLERFRNPDIRHALFDITLQGTTKMAVRVVPTIIDYVERFGRVPQGLAFGFAAHLLFLRGELHNARRRAGLSVPTDDGSDRIRKAWVGVSDSRPSDLRAMVSAVGADISLWGCDLTAIPGFCQAVAEHLSRACTDGVRSSLGALLSALPTPV